MKAPSDDFSATGSVSGPVGATERCRVSSARRIGADLLVWLSLVAFLQVSRGVLLGVFQGEMGSGVTAGQVARCFLTGLRFDAVVATYTCLPLALMSVVACFGRWSRLHTSVRRWLIRLAVPAYVLALVADVAYFKEYHNQFDHWIWGLVFDDRRAIALTVWKSYPVVWLAIGWAMFSWAASWGLIRLTARVAHGPGEPGTRAGLGPGAGGAGTTAASVRLGSIGLALLLVAAVVFGLRGSLGRRPVQIKDMAVCNDSLLDRLVPNPLAALRYAISQHLALSRSVGLEAILPGGDIVGAARAIDPRVESGATVDDCLRRRAEGGAGVKPRQVFLVVMESYDSWAMQPKFAALHLTDRLQALGRAGIAAEAFLPAGAGTMPSLSTLISGLPEVGIQANYRESVRQGVPTAIAKIFKRLGYRTRFFYSGYLTWQRLGEFCTEQGFDEVYGGAAMAARLTGNEWGVDDRVLFRFVQDRTGDEPTFNFIMTTSYHPPYSVDLEAEGCPLKQLPPELTGYSASAEELRILGHLWYSDRSVGEFVEGTSAQHPEAVFAITGDHWSRRSIERSPNVFQRTAVPLVLYGPQVLAGRPRAGARAGSHVDILPTLVELCAPAGFEYHAFGRNLLDPRLPALGFGCSAVVSPEAIFLVDRPQQVESIFGQPLSAFGPTESAAALALRYRQIHAVSWWRIMKGNELPWAASAKTIGR